MNQQQPHLWQNNHSNLVFADLCNALYERELKKLALDPTLPHANLRKRVASLPFYIKRASERIIAFYSPLDLDSQNASWLYRQPKVCPGPKQMAAEIEKFYRRHAKMALIIPIYTMHLTEEYLSLDSIDGIDLKQDRIHTNENGWFGFDGVAQPPESALSSQEPIVHRLLRPVKVSMTCACSGHRWQNNKRHRARVLSLREMLLATNINWSDLTKTLVK